MSREALIRRVTHPVPVTDELRAFAKQYGTDAEQLSAELTAPHFLNISYEFHTVADALELEFTKLLESDVRFRKCERCGKYFIMKLAGISAKGENGYALAVGCRVVGCRIKIYGHSGIPTDKCQLFVLLFQKNCAVVAFQLVDRGQLAKVVQTASGSFFVQTGVGNFQTMFLIRSAAAIFKTDMPVFAAPGMALSIGNLTF